jgi:DNA polymerase III psi subunit
MVPINGKSQLSKAEIGFEAFPGEPCAMEADKVLHSLDGMVQITFNPSVERLAVFFDPKKIKIPLILSTLESFGLKPKVVSVVTPIEHATHR